MIISPMGIKSMIDYPINIDKIRKCPEEQDWDSISRSKYLKEDFIREFQSYVDWWLICRFQYLSESFIREFKDKLDWHQISTHQKLSEHFIIEFEDIVYWDRISLCQDLSQSFIEEYIERLDWWGINQQNISKDFIGNHFDKLDISILYFVNHKISKETKDYIRMFI